MNKPPFDPNQPFQAAEKPPFDPNQPFQPGEDSTTDVVQSRPQAKSPSFMDQAGSVLNQYNKSQFGSPSQLLQSVQPLLSKVSNYVGEKATEALSQGPNHVDPYTAAGIGTVASMAPDIAFSVAGPNVETTPAKPIFRSVTNPMAQRALGLTKRFQSTPFAKQKAVQAADVALDQNVIPLSGNPKEAMDRALMLQEKSGQSLSDMRSQAGNNPIDKVFDSIESARQQATNGLRGGVWDKIHSKFDEASETLLSLVNSYGSEVPTKEVERAKKALSNTVNWIADNVSQQSAKQISRAIESGVEDIMRSKGIDMASYETQKRLYGASKTMQKGLSNEIAAQSGNNAVSLPSMVMGAGQMATGNIPGAAATLGVSEILRRRGAGVASSILDKAGKQLPAKRFLKLPGAVNSLFSGSDATDTNQNSVGNMREPKNAPNSFPDRANTKFKNPNDYGNEQQDQNNQASNIESLGNHPESIAPSKPLTKEIARKFLDLANGSKELARELAKKAGYSW